MTAIRLNAFDALVRAATKQPELHRLLFVFVASGVDDDATPEQKARFKAGRGGTLTPMMCVDRLPEELASFDALVEESREFDQSWDMVFVASLPGSVGASPTSLQAEAPMQRMVDSIKSGSIGGYIAFDTQGRPVQFS